MAPWNGVFAFDASPIEISQLQEPVSISARVPALLTAESRSLEELIPLFDKEGQAAAELIRGGYREGFYWVKIPLVNSGSTPASTNLLIKNRLTSYLEIFVPAPDENAAVSIRRLSTTLPTLAITLAPHKQAHIYPDLSASAPAIISLRSFEIWLVVNGLCFDFLLILDVLLEN